MTKMATTRHISGKNLLNIIFFRTEWPISLKFSIRHRALKYYQVYSNDDPRLTFDLFMQRSALVPYMKLDLRWAIQNHWSSGCFFTSNTNFLLHQHRFLSTCIMEKRKLKLLIVSGNFALFVLLKSDYQFLFCFVNIFLENVEKKFTVGVLERVGVIRVNIPYFFLPIKRIGFWWPWPHLSQWDLKQR